MKCIHANCFSETSLWNEIVYTLLIRMNGTLFENCDESSDAVTWNFLSSWVEFKLTGRNAKILWLYKCSPTVLGPCVRIPLVCPVECSCTFVFNRSLPTSVHVPIFIALLGPGQWLEFKPQRHWRVKGVVAGQTSSRESCRLTNGWEPSCALRTDRHEEADSRFSQFC
jgi:hypothetical protein